jgi:cyanophycin synthetase
MRDGAFDIWAVAGFFLAPTATPMRLAGARLPVRQDILAEDVNDAIHKARRLKWPVILRSPDHNQVSEPLWSGSDVRRAFQDLRSPGGVILSRSIEGDTYRFLVIGGEVISVLHHAHTTASDGTSSPAARTREILGSVHPETRALAERVAHVLELDAVGIDIRTSDATRSWSEVGGVIVGVVGRPRLVAHASPDAGVVQDVAERIFDHLFPSKTPRSIPVAAVTGTCGKTTTCRMLEAILARTGKCVGLATTHGVRIGGREIVSGDCSGAPYAQLVLYHRDVEAAVLETARGGILKRGLGFEACNVAAVLNVSSDHLGERGIETVDDMARVKGFLLEVARDAAVLNADDSSCVSMASRVTARDLYWFTLRSENPLVHAHIEAGGRALRRVGDGNAAQIVFHEGRDSTPLMAVSELPSAFDGLASHNVANAMAAAAMAHALGVPTASIRDALAAFQPNAEINPGRLNVFDGHPFKVIVDMTKNVAAYRALVDLVEGLRVAGQRIAVLSVTGHHRNTDIEMIGELVSGKFDRFVLFTSGEHGTPEEMRANPDATDEYGRRLQEVPELLKRTLIDMGVAPHRIAIVPHRMEAVDCGLRMARAGDLVIIKCNTDFERFWERVVAYRPADDQR